MARLTKCESATGLMVILSAAAVLCTLMFGGKDDWKDIISGWESFFKIAAILGTGVFFAFKACGGYNNLNLSMMPSAERRRCQNSESSDYLAVHVTLEKGPIASFSLEGAEVSFRSGSTTKFQKIHVKRLPTGLDGVDWNPIAKMAEDNVQLEPLFISAGDKMQLACFETVSTTEPCIVDVVVFGRKRRAGAFKAQWRSSMVSLPLAKNS